MKRNSNLNLENRNDEISQPSVEELDGMEPEIIESDIVEPEPAPTFITGKVYGCDKLNIRERPDLNAPVKKVLNKGQTVIVNLDMSIEDWYRVTVEDVIDGYCMKKYVSI